jgi:hypothetical protein
LPVPVAITFAGASASDVSCNLTVNLAPDSIEIFEPPGNVTRPRIISLLSFLKVGTAS